MTRLALFVLALCLGAASAQAQDWQARWAATIAAAKQEGQVVVCQSVSPPRRDFLVKQWQQDFPGIELSLSVVTGTGFVPRVASERAAGRYLWDVFDSGPNVGMPAVQQGMLDPLLPELILPEVSDPELWGGWQDAFYDPEKKYVLALVSDLAAPYYNAKAIAPEKAKALGLKLLLEPEYRGKIVWYDPRIEGPGSPFLVLIERVLGSDAVRKLVVEQEPVFVSNFNDGAQAMVRGKAVIGMGSKPKAVFKPYLDAGPDIDMRPLGNTPETAWRGTDGTTLGVFNKRPHPNAARVFVNWMMTKRISQALAEAQRYDSRRADIAALDPDFAAIPGARYVEAQRDENEVLLRRWMAEIKTLRPQ